jgi:hypothetical protein
VISEHGRAMMTTPKRREEGHTFRIGAVAGIVGSLLAMVGNLLHPAPPIGDPEGVAQTIAQSEIWVPVHLVIVVGLILMLGTLVALSRSIEGGVVGALRVVLAEEAINFAVAALFNILFAGVTFILLGLAVAWSGEYPGWLGWLW